MMRRIISTLVALSLGICTAGAQALDHAIETAEALIREGRYSSAKNYIRLQISDGLPGRMSLPGTPEEKAQRERIFNDLLETQIHTGDYLPVMEELSSEGLVMDSPREYFRLFHLSGLWLRSAPSRAIYGEEARLKAARQCAETACRLFREYESALADEDRRTMERTIWDDLLMAYMDLLDYDSIDRVLDEMKETVEKIPDTRSDWPSVYWYHRAVSMIHHQGVTPDAQTLLKKVLSHALEYNPEFAVKPWYICSISEAGSGHHSEVHDMALATFRTFQEEELKQLHSMTREDRYAVARTNSLVRSFDLLPRLPEGTYEDVLYDAALFSKNILLDLDKETAGFVYSHNDPDLLARYEEKMYHSGGPAAWYPDFLFLEDYLARNPAPCGRTYSWHAVEEKLGAGEVAVEYIRTGTGYSDYNALILRKGWKRPVMVRLGTREQSTGFQADARTHRENARAAGHFMLGPLLPYLSEGDHIYYSADGVIAQLNPDALQLPDGTLAGDRYHLHRVTSTLDIPAQSENPGFENLLLFGDMDYSATTEAVSGQSALYHLVSPVYMREWTRERGNLSGYDFGWIENGGTEERAGYGNLKYTGQEIRTIARLWPREKGCHLYPGIASVEECFKNWGIRNNLAPGSIIHIATHSISRSLDRSKSWMLSRIDEAFKCEGLLFSGAKTSIEDGTYPEDQMNDQILWGEEIAALHLQNAELVVLSACHTARGEDSMDGVLGLQRAFKQAGADTVLMTLWRVNDKATMMFMTAFYKALFSGEGKYASFKSAQAYVRENFSDDPYYWAPFVMLD